jgi:TonB family protein
MTAPSYRLVLVALCLPLALSACANAPAPVTDSYAAAANAPTHPLGPQGDQYLDELQRALLSRPDLLNYNVTGTRQGKLVLEARVSPNGRLLAVSVLESSGWPDIDKQAIEMVTVAGQSLPPRTERLMSQQPIKVVLVVPFPDVPQYTPRSP